ncbi:MAG: hypothetical protein VYA54_07215 [Bdellovibrionota bacterium]|nr:hypothetical protein [Bdellovibrionota bacterium]
MKWMVLLIVVLISVSIWARNDVDLSDFNKEVSKNFQEVLDENPQIYEQKKSRGRAPASVDSKKEGFSEDLNKFDEQAIGPNEL